MIKVKPNGLFKKKACAFCYKSINMLFNYVAEFIVFDCMENKVAITTGINPV